MKKKFVLTYIGKFTVTEIQHKQMLLIENEKVIFIIIYFQFLIITNVQSDN